MKITLHITLCAIGVLAGLSHPELCAQQPRSSPPPARAGNHVAVLDVAKLFKNHPRFKQQIEQVKREISSFEKEVNQKRKELNDLSKNLDQFKVGSPQYKQIEARLAHDTSDIQVRSQLKRKEVLEREARIYFDTYQEIVKIVSQLAQRHGISLIVRYDSEPVDPGERAQVLRGVNQNVVYQGNIDLTDAVMRQMGLQTARGQGPSSLRK